jgi:hypothetical protein
VTRRPFGPTVARQRAVVAATLAAAFALVFAVSGCGVPTEDDPRHVSPPNGPYTDFGGERARAPAIGAAAERLCFIRDDKLVPVSRRIAAWPTIETQIRHLLAGPDATERDAGMTSALTGAMVVAGIRLARGEVTVEIEQSPDDIGRSDEVLAFGQIVCTLTTRADVTGVSFSHDGQRLGIPRADGSLTRVPLTARDYADLMT